MLCVTEWLVLTRNVAIKYVVLSQDIVDQIPAVFVQYEYFPLSEKASTLGLLFERHQPTSRPAAPTIVSCKTNVCQKA